MMYTVSKKYTLYKITVKITVQYDKRFEKIYNCEKICIQIFWKLIKLKNSLNG